MATERHYSPLDRLLLQADTAMRTLLPFSGQPARPSPAIIQPDATLDEQQTRHIAGLIRESGFEARHTPAFIRKLAVPD